MPGSTPEKGKKEDVGSLDPGTGVYTWACGRSISVALGR